MITILKNSWLYIVGAILGGIAGYIYWVYVGCETGNCPITASPTRTSLYWALLGALLFGIFTKNKSKSKKE